MRVRQPLPARLDLQEVTPHHPLRLGSVSTASVTGDLTDTYKP
jgi:hypothetical protein